MKVEDLENFLVSRLLARGICMMILILLVAVVCGNGLFIVICCSFFELIISVGILKLYVFRIFFLIVVVRCLLGVVGFLNVIFLFWM